MSELTIVTGGAGFIGSHLVEALAAAGRQVRVVERPGARVDHLPADVELVFADICDRPAVDRAIEGGTWVYHLAANPNLWARDPREFERVNHQGARNVIDAALAAGARRVLHTSTESILTKANVKSNIDENVRVSADDAVGPYCLSKLLAEEFAFAKARDGLPVVVANPTMPVGPGDRGLSPPTRLILDFCARRLPAIMDCTLNVIDVRDVACGLVMVMERGEPGRRYLLGNANLTLRELCERLRELTGVPPPRFTVAYPVALLAAWASELVANHVTGRAPKATVTGVRLARRLLHFDATRTLAELGLRPRPICSSLADAVAWLRMAGHLTAAT
jgi:dihydroflavonol-4-reductase